MRLAVNELCVSDSDRYVPSPKPSDDVAVREYPPEESPTSICPDDGADIKPIPPYVTPTAVPCHVPPTTVPRFDWVDVKYGKVLVAVVLVAVK